MRDVTPVGSPLPQYYSNLTSALRGSFSPEVSSAWDKIVAQKTAEQGWQSGLPGSQFSGYAGLYNYFQPLMQRMSQAESQISARYPYAMQFAMQQHAATLAANEAIRQDAMRRNAEASRRWQMGGGGTPPIVGAGGGAPRITAPSTMSRVSDIARRYSPSEPMGIGTVDGGSSAPGPMGAPSRIGAPAMPDVFEPTEGMGYSLTPFGYQAPAEPDYVSWWSPGYGVNPYGTSFDLTGEGFYDAMSQATYPTTGVPGVPDFPPLE